MLGWDPQRFSTVYLASASTGTAANFVSTNHDMQMHQVHSSCVCVCVWGGGGWSFGWGGWGGEVEVARRASPMCLELSQAGSLFGAYNALLQCTWRVHWQGQ